VAGPLRKLFPERDPYWDRFVNKPLADPRNLIVDLITTSSGGGVSAAKMDVHDPAAMSGHMLQLAEFWGADSAGVAATDAAWFLASEPADSEQNDHAEITAFVAEHRCAIVCGIRRVFEAAAQGMGGRLAEQKLAVANFNLRSYIREIGYAAEFATPLSVVDPAIAAGLGRLGGGGRFLAREGGAELVLGQVVVTNLPMEPSIAPEPGK
jgi:hypothetical protein